MDTTNAPPRQNRFYTPTVLRAMNRDLVRRQLDPQQRAQAREFYRRQLAVQQRVDALNGRGPSLWSRLLVRVLVGVVLGISLGALAAIALAQGVL